MMSSGLSTQLIQLIAYEIEITQKHSATGHTSTMRAMLESYNAEKEDMILLFGNGDRILVMTNGERFTLKRAKEMK